MGLYKALHDILDICLQRKRRALYKVLFFLFALGTKGGIYGSQAWNNKRKIET